MNQENISIVFSKFMMKMKPLCLFDEYFLFQIAFTISLFFIFFPKKMKKKFSIFQFTLQLNKQVNSVRLPVSYVFKASNVAKIFKLIKYKIYKAGSIAQLEEHGQSELNRPRSGSSILPRSNIFQPQSLWTISDRN